MPVFWPWRVLMLSAAPGSLWAGRESPQPSRWWGGRSPPTPSCRGGVRPPPGIPIFQGVPIFSQNCPVPWWVVGVPNSPPGWGGRPPHLPGGGLTPPTRPSCTDLPPSPSPSSPLLSSCPPPVPANLSACCSVQIIRSEIWRRWHSSVRKVLWSGVPGGNFPTPEFPVPVQWCQSETAGQSFFFFPRNSQNAF